MTAKPIIPWIGGKRRLAKEIIPMFPEHTCYVEPFCGAAALLFMKEQTKVEVLNDINGELTNLYRVVQHHLEEFVRQFKWALTSRKIFEWEKMKHPETLTDIQRAARFFYLQKNCFGAKVANQTFGTAPSAPPKFNLLRIEEDLSAAHMRLCRAYIENLPWDKVITKYDRDETLFYMDPPYWQTEGYGVEFGLEQYDLMAKLMRSMKGKSIVSVNDHPAMREAFAGLSMKTLQIKYTVGGGAKSKKAGELLIWNW